MLACRSGGYEGRTATSEAGSTSAAPTAWTTRAATNTHNPYFAFYRGNGAGDLHCRLRSHKVKHGIGSGAVREVPYRLYRVRIGEQRVVCTNLPCKRKFFFVDVERDHR